MKQRLQELIIPTLIRTVRTMAQTALGMITVGATLSEINWTYILSVSAVSGIYCLVLSIAGGLPEAGADGVIEVDTSDELKDQYKLSFDTPLTKINNKKSVNLKVKNK